MVVGACRSASPASLPSGAPGASRGAAGPYEGVSPSLPSQLRDAVVRADHASYKPCVMLSLFAPSSPPRVLPCPLCSPLPCVGPDVHAASPPSVRQGRSSRAGPLVMDSSALASENAAVASAWLGFAACAGGDCPLLLSAQQTFQRRVLCRVSDGKPQSSSLLLCV